MKTIQAKFEYPAWFKKFPKWFRPAVFRARRRNLLGPIRGSTSAESLCCELSQDNRFHRLLDHCGGEDGAFIAEPYQTEESIRGEADEFAALLGCNWRAKSGTWHPGTIRIEFRPIEE
jgi:hypothetical protein